MNPVEKMIAIHYKRPRRTFNPEVSARYGRPTFPINKLVKYSPKWGWTRMFNFPFSGSFWRPRMHTIVVSVDGPCKINDSSDPDSQAGWAVYFGPNDPKNGWGLVPSDDPQTNSRAELEAVYQALVRIRAMKLIGHFETSPNPYREVIIRVTSEYVQNTFHRYVWKWQVNGWKTIKGNDVAHADLIYKIHQLICDMELNMCMAVRFWKTERDARAKALGQLAFEEE